MTTGPQSEGAERLGTGLFLPNDLQHLGMLENLILNHSDYFELTPETAWTRTEPGSRIEDHSGMAMLQEIRQETGKPFVGHGLGYSLGTPLMDEGPEALRSRQWFAAIERAITDFELQWYTEHLGFAALPDGRQLILPCPMPHSAESVEASASRLKQLKTLVPAVGFENSVFYFTLGDPLEEADYYDAVCAAADCHLLLDVHNVYTHCRNFNLDIEAFLDRIPFDRVIEIHLSGGSDCNPDWLPSGRAMRLDSHDDLIPPDVWSLYEAVLPECANVRGVTVERLDGTLALADVPAFEEEFLHAQEIFASASTQQTRVPPSRPEFAGSPGSLETVLQLIGDALLHNSPRERLATSRDSITLSSHNRAVINDLHIDGFVLSGLIVSKLRFERVVRGKPENYDLFLSDEETFTQVFKAYNEAVTPDCYFPIEEAHKFSNYMDLQAEGGKENI